MEITYLKELKDHPSKNPSSSGYNPTNRPITLSEIEHLETLYNNGSPFPKVLKELLFLAGNFCYVLDYGINDTQEEMQEMVREYMQEENKTIGRPFYAVDVYNASDTFLFIYLDEGDNPYIFQASYYADNSSWIKKIKPDSLSELISNRIQRAQAGENPF